MGKDIQKKVESEIDSTYPELYIRVGINYYKLISKYNRWGILNREIKPWKKDEIKQDYGTEYLRQLQKFDDFIIEPDNFNYKQVIGNCFNRYAEFPHKPVPGAWPWTKKMLQHIFGEQYELGIRYLKILICFPKRMLPILALVSKIRGTGKTTFVNWIDMLFGANLVIISSQDLSGSFNAYATANVIVIEETLIEKQISVEKLKALSTAKTVTLNEKFMQQVKLPFYGKIILTSNNEDRFARIDQEEVRFFIRKLPKPKEFNADIENELFKEIPAFIDYIKNLPAPDFSTDRSGFTPEELNNRALEALKKESKTSLYHNLFELFTDYFNNNECTEIRCTLKDLKDQWFEHDSKVDHHYLKHVIKNEYNLEAQHLQRYANFSGVERVGRPYIFEKSMFINDNDHESYPF